MTEANVEEFKDILSEGLEGLCEQYGKTTTACFISPNECDSNLEPANVVDGLFAIARSINNLVEVIEYTKDGSDVSIGPVKKQEIRREYDLIKAKGLEPEFPRP